MSEKIRRTLKERAPKSADKLIAKHEDVAEQLKVALEKSNAPAQVHQVMDAQSRLLEAESGLVEKRESVRSFSNQLAEISDSLDLLDGVGEAVNEGIDTGFDVLGEFLGAQGIDLPREYKDSFEANAAAAGISPEIMLADCQQVMDLVNSSAALIPVFERNQKLFFEALAFYCQGNVEKAQEKIADLIIILTALPVANLESSMGRVEAVCNEIGLDIDVQRYTNIYVENVAKGMDVPSPEEIAAALEELQEMVVDHSEEAKVVFKDSPYLAYSVLAFYVGGNERGAKARMKEIKGLLVERAEKRKEVELMLASEQLFMQNILLGFDSIQTELKALIPHYLKNRSGLFSFQQHFQLVEIREKQLQSIEMALALVAVRDRLQDSLAGSFSDAEIQEVFDKALGKKGVLEMANYVEVPAEGRVDYKRQKSFAPGVVLEDASMEIGLHLPTEKIEELKNKFEFQKLYAEKEAYEHTHGIDFEGERLPGREKYKEAAHKYYDREAQLAHRGVELAAKGLYSDVDMDAKEKESVQDTLRREMAVVVNDFAELQKWASGEYHIEKIVMRTREFHGNLDRLRDAVSFGRGHDGAEKLFSELLDDYQKNSIELTEEAIKKNPEILRDRDKFARYRATALPYAEVMQKNFDVALREGASANFISSVKNDHKKYRSSLLAGGSYLTTNWKHLHGYGMFVNKTFRGVVGNVFDAKMREIWEGMKESYEGIAEFAKEMGKVEAGIENLDQFEEGAGALEAIYDLTKEGVIVLGAIGGAVAAGALMGPGAGVVLKTVGMGFGSTLGYASGQAAINGDMSYFESEVFLKQWGKSSVFMGGAQAGIAAGGAAIGWLGKAIANRFPTLTTKTQTFVENHVRTLLDKSVTPGWLASSRGGLSGWVGKFAENVGVETKEEIFEYGFARLGQALVHDDDPRRQFIGLLFQLIPGTARRGRAEFIEGVGRINPAAGVTGQVRANGLFLEYSDKASARKYLKERGASEQVLANFSRTGRINLENNGLKIVVSKTKAPVAIREGLVSPTGKKIESKAGLVFNQETNSYAYNGEAESDLRDFFEGRGYTVQGDENGNMLLVMGSEVVPVVNYGVEDAFTGLDANFDIPALAEVAAMPGVISMDGKLLYLDGDMASGIEAALESNGYNVTRAADGTLKAMKGTEKVEVFDGTKFRPDLMTAKGLENLAVSNPELFSEFVRNAGALDISVKQVENIFKAQERAGIEVPPNTKLHLLIRAKEVQELATQKNIDALVDKLLANVPVAMKVKFEGFIRTICSDPRVASGLMLLSGSLPRLAGAKEWYEYLLSPGETLSDAGRWLANAAVDVIKLGFIAPYLLGRGWRYANNAYSAYQQGTFNPTLGSKNLATKIAHLPRGMMSLGYGKAKRSLRRYVREEGDDQAKNIKYSTIPAHLRVSTRPNQTLQKHVNFIASVFSKSPRIRDVALRSEIESIESELNPGLIISRFNTAVDLGAVRLIGSGGPDALIAWAKSIDAPLVRITELLNVGDLNTLTDGDIQALNGEVETFNSLLLSQQRGPWFASPRDFGRNSANLLSYTIMDVAAVMWGWHIIENFAEDDEDNEKEENAPLENLSNLRSRNKASAERLIKSMNKLVGNAENVKKKFDASLAIYNANKENPSFKNLNAEINEVQVILAFVNTNKPVLETYLSSIKEIDEDGLEEETEKENDFQGRINSMRGELNKIVRGSGSGPFGETIKFIKQVERVKSSTGNSKKAGEKAVGEKGADSTGDPIGKAFKIMEEIKAGKPKKLAPQLAYERYQEKRKVMIKGILTLDNQSRELAKELLSKLEAGIPEMQKNLKLVNSKFDLAVKVYSENPDDPKFQNVEGVSELNSINELQEALATIQEVLSVDTVSEEKLKSEKRISRLRERLNKFKINNEKLTKLQPNFDNFVMTLQQDLPKVLAFIEAAEQ